MQAENTHFAGGFTAPATDAAHAFRAAMNAMARPGQFFDITGAQAPAGISIAAGTLLLTLCDPETKLFLADDVDSEALRVWVTFHTGAPIVPAAEADFALGGWDALLPLDQYRIGTSEYPDRSATLIVEQPAFGAPTAVLSGPGIKDQIQMSLPDVTALQRNTLLFPLGIDLFFTAGSQVMALPRSSQISEEA
ncbi:phosphonate C-P lyase system protein PhnH [Epibacterium ulvae]|uniref:phosphonate C-P lyase system protein PhnH n=1 Tax=Epibacterium ulvae TaxID=1156985 RepID=UPI001BFC8C07|nr:phosphonate C-P lyase system protein PhnH [Epibacterium ulvae]MBT8154011.1 phosphonate C-P lyase system protein PhnH [Epibacterium ulvae]